MIDTAEQATTECLACGSPIIQIAGRGHRKRLYCDDRCRQRAHRQNTANVTPNVTNGDLQQCIAQLEQELEQAEQGRDQVQQRFAEFVRTTNEKTAQLIGELDQYRKVAALMDRAKMEARFMDLGEQVQYQTLTTLNILGGYGYWQDFMKRAKDETLLKAIAAAEYYLEGLIALRGDPQQQRIADLERQVKDLQGRLNVEERYRDDTQVRHFKSWLRRRRLPQDADFLRLFLEDTRLPPHASRSMYIARLKQYGYTAEDIAVFEEAWKDMLFSQS